MGKRRNKFELWGQRCHECLILFLLLLLHVLPELKVDEDIQTGEDRGQDEDEEQPQVNQL